MKIKFKNLIYYFTLAILLVSCQEDEVDYTPKVYAPSPDLSVATGNVTDTSFDVNYISQGDGVLYYAIDLSSEPAPDAEAIIRRNSGAIVTAKADLTSGTAWTYTMDTNVYGAYDYSIYSVMTSVDGIASSVIKTNVTTTDTVAPEFVRDDTTPAHNVTPGTNSPFGTITLAFSEPVFYKGGDVTFQGFFGGRTITVNGASNFSTNGTTVTIADHGTFSPDDAIVVTWADGTFQDKSGKNVAELAQFAYYFYTRDFSIAEKASLMPGQYDYSTVFYGALNGFYSGLNTGNPGAFLPATGSYEITADASDATGHTLVGINLFSGFVNLGLTDEPQSLPIVINPTVADELDVMPNVPSVITAGEPTYWSNYGGSIFGIPFELPGFYDFDAGTITHYVQLKFSSDGAGLDDIDYIYTRTDDYARSRDAKSMSMDELINLSKSRKKLSKKDFNGTFSY
ncbi:hypothetical protein H9W90_08525 [Polaribacter pectinis]|uniref:Uncharacterized protein n=1 Tax=Polaribacter pectinis TaxID=2738844 RepID=A0A7G9L6K7_9FLAO|nr:hypothetical protein [Polaribacter pectinis]QNM84256.1 hypothetical protein H9W90_08525 [Polaribacter pectinis]